MCTAIVCTVLQPCIIKQHALECSVSPRIEEGCATSDRAEADSYLLHWMRAIVREVCASQQIPLMTYRLRGGRRRLLCAATEENQMWMTDQVFGVPCDEYQTRRQNGTVRARNGRPAVSA